MRAVIVLSILSIEIYSIPSTGLHVIKLRILALTKHFYGSSNTPTMKSSLQYCTNIAIRYDSTVVRSDFFLLLQPLAVSYNNIEIQHI